MQKMEPSADPTQEDAETSFFERPSQQIDLILDTLGLSESEYTALMEPMQGDIEETPYRYSSAHHRPISQDMQHLESELRTERSEESVEWFVRFASCLI